MLTGDLEPTSGTAYRSSYNIRNSLNEYRLELGYCPQFDALLDKLTGRETLLLFCRLRGIQPKLHRGMVNRLIEISDLKHNADKRVDSLSGGNKRKLSLAMALIGSPKIILLDEPTAGVDPSARRRIWTTLNDARNRRGCSVILTSHSMQECENLCSRISIMVAGSFRCLGSTQHLRSKFGKGFTISIKLERERLADPSYTSAVHSFIQSAFPSVTVLDQHETMWTYHVPDPNLLWSQLFSKVEDAKKQFDFEDYSISDTTLEQIFISFARNQSKPVAPSVRKRPSDQRVVEIRNDLPDGESEAKL